MLTIVIPVTDDYDKVSQTIHTANQQAECLELRLDYLSSIDIQKISQLRQLTQLPVIFTLRKSSQGGFYPFDETQRINDILQLCALNPDYLDLEYDVSESIFQNIAVRYPKIKLLCSYHDFSKTPDDLASILTSMHKNHIYTYKIATMAQSTTDALRMLKFIRQTQSSTHVTGICMGERGSCTRILSSVMGNIFHYASLDNQQTVAPGQLTVDTLINTYRFKKLNKNTRIYALLGDPVDKSVGHIFHNRAINLLEQNAVYLKLSVSVAELSNVISLCRELPFAGFSITMPLKEKIISYLDETESSSQAINSIIIQNGKWIGFNTDGKGAVSALIDKTSLSQQTIVILGAGGSAKAIAQAAVQAGAKVIIINRTIDTAQQLAKQLHCEAYGLEYIARLKQLNYTILINTLPISDHAMQELIKPDYLIPDTFAMDIVYQPIHTSFLKIAAQANCICIPGYEMYINQALLQIQRWFDSPL